MPKSVSTASVIARPTENEFNARLNRIYGEMRGLLADYTPKELEALARFGEAFGAYAKYAARTGDFGAALS